MKTLLQRRKQVASLPPVRDQYYPLSGGLDITTPAMTRGPGTFDAVRNYELSVSGDQMRITADRVEGYERYDGQASPSDATYYAVTFDSGSTEPSDDDVLSGQSSGTTGKVVEVTLSSGTWAGGDAAGTFYLSLYTGSGFTDDELIDNDTTTDTNIATVNGTPVQEGADNDTNHYTYISLAIEDQRALIGKVPSTDATEPVRGVWIYNASVYAFRDTEVLDFTSGSDEPTLGDTLSGQTSGATGVLAGVFVTSGAWATNDAAGFFVFSAVTGTWQAETVDNDTQTQTDIATASAATTKESCMWEDSSSGWVCKHAGNIAGGRFDFVNYNFGTGQKMYGVDGKNKAFQWDGTTWTDLTSNLATDTPQHVTAHANQLWLSFQSSLVHQDTGDPTAHTNTDEFNTSDDVTGLMPYRKQLTVLDRNRLWNLSGTSASDFVFGEISTTSGAIEWTAQDLGRVRYLDDNGFTTLEATDAAGNFDHATFSQRIQPLITKKKTMVTCSGLKKSKNLYRIYFSDDSGITFTMADNNKVVGFTQIEYDHSIECYCSGEDASGNEVTFFGSDDGYVRQNDKGNSFDGNTIVAWMQLSYYHYKSPRTNKRFRRIQVEMEAARPVGLVFRPDFDYGDATVQESNELDLTVSAGGGLWDVENWDEFVWTAGIVALAKGKVTGKGYNMGVLIYSDSDTTTNEPGHSIQGLITDFTLLRRDRS